MDEVPLVDGPLAVRHTIGRNIRYWRKQGRLSLHGVAVESGYSVQALSQIERGLIDAKTSTLVAIAKALKVSPAEFFRETLDASRYVPVTSPNVLRLVHAAEKLPASWRQFVVTVAESISEWITDHKEIIQSGQWVYLYKS